MIIYSFYDESAQFFGPPVMAENINLLQRNLRELAQQQPAQLPFMVYPNEFVIYEIGAYDQKNGQLEATNPPARLGKVAEFLGQAQ